MSPSVSKTLKCTQLHHSNPYLKMGPFKFEQKHYNPEIALLHDFVSVRESDNVKKLTKGNLITTPYITRGGENEFSKERTSKVMYLNELLVPEAMSVSKKIELATRFRLKHEHYASENYQVMNYGLGGKISPHVDSIGRNFGSNYTSRTETTSEAISVGGNRFVTFMVYL